MEGLFFVIEPLWWRGDLSHILSTLGGSLGLSVIVFFGIGYWHQYHERRRIHAHLQSILQISRQRLMLIAPGDAGFASRSLVLIREYLTERSSQNSIAHTPREIGVYERRDGLREIIRVLETSEYLGKPLTEEHARAIQKQLLDFFV